MPGYDPPGPVGPIYAPHKTPNNFALGGIGTLNPVGSGGGGGGGGTQGARTPGHIRIPGFTPDYQSLIQQDPYFAQVRDALSAQSASDAAQRDKQLGQAFINFGEAPAGYESLVGDAAANNPFSALAQLQRAYEQNTRNTKNQLASRGILQSGETGYQLGNENRDYLQNQYEARQQLLDFLNGVEAAFASNEQNRSNELIQAGQQAYQNQVGLPQNTPTSPFRANLLASWHGGAYYKGKDGKLYDAQGQALNVGQEVSRLRHQINLWRQQGHNWRWVRRTSAWNALQSLLGSQ